MNTSPPSSRAGGVLVPTVGAWVSQVALVVKNSLANSGDLRDAGSLGGEDALEEGMATHSRSPGMHTPAPLTPQSNQAAPGGQCPSGALRRTACPAVSGTPAVLLDSRSVGTRLISLKKIDPA